MTFDNALSIFEENLPESVVTALLLVLAIGVAAKGLTWIKELVTWIAETLSLLNIGERRRQAERRKHFVDSLIERLKQINKDERWSDRRYSELEAEVEVEGSRTGVKPMFRLISSSNNGHRRERSLSRALRRSSDRLILLQGDPGSGKSVALRHVALDLARRASKSRRRNVVIALYVSLKDFRPATMKIGSNDIRQFVLDTHRSLDEPRQVKYLRENFDEGIDNGTWFFLFDSFDEIPEVLGAVEVDSTIRKYEDAVRDFLQNVAPCRGVLASREYRGPRRLDWPQFLLVQLSDRRRHQLITQSRVDVRARRLIKAQLPNAPSNVRSLATNPMFLGLLCEYVERERHFPPTTHAVFESYVKQCLDDEDRELLFGLKREEVRTVAQELAFCMAAEPGLGLSVEIEELDKAMSTLGFETHVSKVRPTVEALRRVHLARSEHDAAALSGPPFSFAHRRFQEYFATCLVLQNPQLVPPHAMLTNGRWRETAVTVLQMHPPESTTGIIAEADKMLSEFASSLSMSATGFGATSVNEPQLAFHWPNRALHLLALLDAGLATRSSGQHPEIAGKIGDILIRATEHGVLVDRKWALDVAGPAPIDTLVMVLRAFFRSGSAWLRDAAFRQIGRLKPIPNDMALEIARGLLTYSISGRLRRESLAVTAQLQRLDDPQDLLRSKKLLRGLPWIDALLHAVFVSGVLIAGFLRPSSVIMLAVISWGSLFFVRATPRFSWSVGASTFAGMLRFARYHWGEVFTAICFVTRSLFPALAFPDEGVSRGLALWAVAWAPSVIVTLRYGRVRHPWLLLVPQALVVHAAWVSAVAFMRRVGLRRLLTHFLPQAILLVLSILVLLVALAYVSDTPVGGAVFALIIISLVVTTTVVVARRAIQAMHDNWHLWSLTRHTPERISGQEVVDILSTYHTEPGRQRVVRYLRQRRVLSRSPAALVVLVDLITLREFVMRYFEREESDLENVYNGAVRQRRLGERETCLDNAPIATAEVRGWVDAMGAKRALHFGRSNADYWDEIAKSVDEWRSQEALTGHEVAAVRP